MARTSSAPRQPMATSNGAKFVELCAALKSNDPTVTSVNAADRRDTPQSYGRRLGMALRRNTMVSSISLNLSFLLSERARKADGAATLLEWFRQRSSLHTVILHYRHCLYHYQSANHVEIVLLRRILQAVAQNAAIQVVELPCLEHFPVKVWTKCLAISGSSGINVNLLRLVFTEETSDSELEAAAKAIGALSTLENLYMKGPNVRTILQELQSDSCPVQLHQLTLEDDYHGPVEDNESTMTLLSSVVRKSKQLQHLALCALAVTVEGWRLVSCALQANPSVTELTMDFPDSAFSKKAVALFLDDMRCSDASKQHIHKLTIECYALEGIRLVKNVASMLCGSLIRHFAIGSDLLEERAFFNVWNTRAAVIQLESLQLERVTKEVLQNLAPFVKQTVHLRRLTCNMDSFTARRHHEQAPDAFLVALRRNASLHEVHLNGFCEILSRPEARARQAIIVRTIEAVTTRNRLLPGMLTRAFVVLNDHDDNTPSPTTTAAFRQFPALCVVSTQAPRMAANTLLKALLPVVDALETIHRRDGKRVYNDQA